MKTIERIIWIVLITTVIACADLAPKKNFISTLYYVDWDTRCLTYVDNETLQTLTRCFDHYEEFEPGKYHAVDDSGKYMDDLIVISTVDFQKELDFQNLLKKQCRKWESGN